MSDPEAPQGVRVRHADGTATPCTVTYDGPDDEGYHIWLVHTHIDFDNGETLSVDMMPARTSIVVSATSTSDNFGVEWRDKPDGGKWWHTMLRAKKPPEE